MPGGVQEGAEKPLNPQIVLYFNADARYQRVPAVGRSVVAYPHPTRQTTDNVFWMLAQIKSSGGFLFLFYREWGNLNNFVKKDFMSELLIYPKNNGELKLIQDLMQRLNIKALLLTEKQEELALVNAMNEVDRTKFVSRQSVMKKLKNK